MYFCVCLGVTAEEARKEGWIKLKNVYALGWKLSSEGMYEITQ